MSKVDTKKQVLLTTGQAAELLQLSESGLKKLVYSGAIPSITIGRARRIPRQALEERLRQLGAGDAFRLDG